MVSRREFLKTLAAAAIGGAILPALGSLEAARAQSEEVYELPWPYAPLDIEETLRRGHLGYYGLECAGGAFWALASQLAEKVGGVWKVLPELPLNEFKSKVLAKKHVHGLMQYGAGGGVGFAVLCGALNGSLFIIQVVTVSKEIYDKLGRILMRTYEIFPFPSDIANRFAAEGKFYVPRSKMKYPDPLPQSVSGSTLCHVSVSKWCMRSGFASGSKERSERCGRLTGDVAAMAATLLNAFYEVASSMGYIKNNRFDYEAAKGSESKILDGIINKLAEYRARGGAAGFYASWLLKGTKLSATTAACRVCHYKGKDYEMGQFTRGYMECEACHKDLTPHAHYMIQMPQTLTHHEMAVEEFNRTAPIFTGIMGAIAGVVAGAALAKKSSEEK